MVQKHGLGRGLSSLIPQKNNDIDNTPTSKSQILKTKKQVKKNTAEDKKSSPAPDKIETKDVVGGSSDEIKEVRIGMVRANTQQPRTYFDEEKLEELTSSIKTHGVLQPLIAVHNGDHYELIAGERRLRASKKAGLGTVPVIIKNQENFDEQKKLELALIENIQRHDLNLVEEAKSYQKLAEEFDLTQEEISARTGKSRSVVANRIRILSLPVEIQKGLVIGTISEGHAKVILSIANSQKQIALYKMIVDEKLTVRQTENKLLTVTGEKKRKFAKEKTPQSRRLEDQLSQYFGTKVRVNEKAQGGNITVSYFSEEELNDVLSKLKIS